MTFRSAAMARRRRALLATIAASGLSTVAGCAAIDRGETGPTTNDGSDDRTSETDDGFEPGSVYGAVPATTVTASSESTTFIRLEPAALSGKLDWLGQEGRQRLGRQLERTPLRLALPAERIDEVLTSEPVTVVDGEFTAEEVFDAYDYDDDGVERVGTDGDYVLGRSSGAPAGTRDVAARDGRWLRVRGGVEPALAAERDEGDGLGSVDRALSDHVAATSSGGISAHQFYGEPVGQARESIGEGAFEGVIAWSMDLEIGEESVELESQYLFADSAAADAAPVDEWLAEQSAFAPYDLDPRQDGRTIRMRGSIPTTEFDLLQPESGDRGPRPPRVSFEFEVDGETLRITHTQGDTVPTDELTVYVGDEPAPTQFAGEDVAAGDSVSVDVSDVEGGTTVRVVWSTDDASAVLASFTLP